MTAIYVFGALRIGATFGFCWRETIRLGVALMLLGTCWPVTAWP